MTINPRHDFKPCAPGAFAGGLRRAEFFDGMVLSEADMKREQSYWQMKRRLTNRALGQGVVWGLNVVWDEKSRCFTVCPGYGLSCCGDDLIVECPETVCERDLIDPCSAEFKHLFADKTDPCNCDPDPRGPVEACLMLEYVECPEDPRQVFEDVCAEVAGGCRYGAVRETTRLRLVPPPPPPPPSPIEEFCKKIAQIREALVEETGIALPDPAFEAGPAVVNLELEAYDTNDVSLGRRAEKVALEADKGAVVSLPGSGAIDDIAVRVTPGGGYVFASVTVDSDPPRDVETMMGFESRQTRSGLDTYSNRLEIRMVPLLGGGENYQIMVDLAGRVSESGFEVAATVSSVRREPAREDCQSLLENWLIFQTDPRCVVRTMALALTCGWFKGQLGSPACAGEQDPPGQVKEALAWLICWVSWKFYWGIDITDDRAKGVERCLQKLFEAWCEGFHYKGPQCHDNEHGIILGCLKLSPKGKILCFDAWAHRRHVLTGPLISHWGTQVGLAPMDVVAGRLASWLCCVARAPMPQPPEGGLEGFAGVLPLGSLSVAVGDVLQPNESIAGLRVSSVRAAGSAGFMVEALSALTRADALAARGTGAVDVISAPGERLHLLVPSERVAAELSHARGVIAEVAREEVAAVAPMAKAASLEMLEAISAETALSRLKLAGDAAAHAPVLDALEAIDVNSVEALLSRDAEEVTELVRPVLLASSYVADAEAADKALGQVYGAAHGLVRATGAALRAESDAREAADPFTRGDIAEAGTVSAVRKAANAHLKSRGMTEATVRAMAKRVAGRS